MTINETREPAITPLAESMDTSVRVQDDLFRFINGSFLANHVIPADRARDGAFTVLHDLSELRVKQLIEETAAEESGTGEAKQIGDLYASFMATDALEAMGSAPLRADVDPITAAMNKDTLARVMGALLPTGIGGGVDLLVNTDFADPDTYRVFLVQGGIGLPDESYYREEKHESTRTAYVAHIAATLELTALVGAEEAMGAAERVMAVETELASHHWDQVTTREANLIYNPMTWQELVASAPGFQWETWREAIGAPAGAFDDVVVAMPSYVRAFAEVWSRMDLGSLRTWLVWQATRQRAPYLSSQFDEEHFDFYGRVLTGAEEQRERWKRGVAVVEAAMGQAVGKLYVTRHFPPGHKAAMQQLVDNLIEAYRQSIATLDWMGPATRERALQKLAAFTTKIGYPEQWRDYSSMTIDATDLLENIREANRFETRRNFAKIGQPVDRDEWFMPPQMVNAYYNQTMNEIVFPAAILQPPFFDADADDAWNYGGIGAVIGHEIGHGFDDQGAKFDGQGRLADWWTDEDRAEFEVRTKALISQYDAYSPAQLDDEHTVNGAFTVGENIGDLGGLTIAIKAYDIALRNQGLAGLDEAPISDGLAGLQRVFYSWARIWQEKARDAEAIRLLSIDPHSPSEFRCNGVVRNLDSFADAFGVTEGDALYLPPEDRVSIW